MQVTYELTPRDFLESFLAHRNRNTFVKWLFWLAAAVLFLVAGEALLLLATRPSIEILCRVALPVGLAAAWAALMWILPWWQARTQFAKYPPAQRSRTLLVDAMGVHWRWPGRAVDTPWNNVFRSLEAKNHFLLYTSPGSFNIVPKRALTPEELSDFRSLLAQHLAETVRP